MEQIRQKSLTKRQKEFIEIYKNKMCLVSKSCEAAKLSRAMYYRWLEQETFKQAVEESKQSIKDFAEDALYDLIKEKNPSAILFYNKTKNKDRGYIEKSEQTVEHKGIEQLKVIIEEKIPDGDKPSTIPETKTSV